MLRALIESVKHNGFQDLSPVGFDEANINWVVEIGAAPGDTRIVGPFKAADMRRSVPSRGDRAGTVSDENLKPALLVDRASYALGVGKNGTVEDSLEHRGFVDLVRRAMQTTGNPEAGEILRFLERFEQADFEKLRRQIASSVKPNAMVAFRTTALGFPFENSDLRQFWREHLESEYSTGNAFCSICGRLGPILRILPFQTSLFSFSCPLSSFNKSSFTSFGKEQTANSPLCFKCASTASRALQFLIDSERHRRVLARDDTQGKAPLRNHLAIFWLKEPLGAGAEGDVVIDVESLLAHPLSEQAPDAEIKAPADIMQVNRLYSLPWHSDPSVLNLDRNRFYLAIISPNKSRLVVREWIDDSLDAIVRRLADFDSAATIVHHDGVNRSRPTIPTIVSALKPWRSKSSGADANLVRGLVRTAYLGCAPPRNLLENAVRRIRIPDRPKNRREEQELLNRRSALVAAIKLALTYGTQEAQTLQNLDMARKTAPYLCGQLLAVLEEAQLRSSRWKINARLVDRFYSGASTSPATTLSLLVSFATKAHFPKIRKQALGYDQLERSMERIMSGLDESGGFPKVLTLREQGEFALGFYVQRADFHASRAALKKPEIQPPALEVTNAN